MTTTDPPEIPTAEDRAWLNKALDDAPPRPSAPKFGALVLSIPAFCARTEPPSPAAPQASTCHRSAARSAERSTTASSTAAAIANRATTSHACGNHDSAALDRGTLVPQATPAAASAAMARVRELARTMGVFMSPSVHPHLSNI